MPRIRSSLLADARFRWMQARRHLSTMNREVGAFREGKSYTIVRDVDADKSEYVYQCRYLEPFPSERLGLIIGDCLHNAKAALNSIVRVLAGSEFDYRVEFPIYVDAYQFEHTARRWASKKVLIHKSAIAELRSLQPYHLRDPRKDSLWMLNELIEHDNHKIIRPILISGRGNRSAFSHTNSSETPIQADPRLEASGGLPREAQREPDANNLEARVIPAPQDSRRSSRIQFGVAFEPTIFGGGCYVQSYLTQLMKRIDEIISSFQSLLERNPHWVRVESTDSTH